MASGHQAQLTADTPACGPPPAQAYWVCARRPTGLYGVGMAPDGHATRSKHSMPRV